MSEAEETMGNGSAMVRVGNSVALDRATAAQPKDIGEVFQLARAIADAKGLVPRDMLGNPNKIAASMMTGLEMGMGAMESLRSFHIIEGKVVMTAEAMLGRATSKGVRVRWLNKPEDGALIAHGWFKRGEDEHEEIFTIEDAKRAKLTGKDNWVKYPKSMLRARCVSQAMRAFCPDVLGSNVYVEDEADEIAERASAREPVVGFGDALRDTDGRSEAIDAETESELEAADRELVACATDADVVAWVGRWRSTIEQEPMGPAKRDRWKRITSHARGVTPPLTTDAMKRVFAAARQPVAPDGDDYLAPIRAARDSDAVRAALRNGVGERLRSIDPQGDEARTAWDEIARACDRVQMDPMEAEAIVDQAE